MLAGLIVAILGLVLGAVALALAISALTKLESCVRYAAGGAHVVVAGGLLVNGDLQSTGSAYIEKDVLAKGGVQAVAPIWSGSSVYSDYNAWLGATNLKPSVAAPAAPAAKLHLPTLDMATGTITRLSPASPVAST